MSRIVTGKVEEGLKFNLKSRVSLSSLLWLCIITRCTSTMKGGGRKEPPVGGEVTCKRPKRKCLQWHPLLSKKALDFSEEEEEEDEEELEKVSACERVFHSPLILDRPLSFRLVPSRQRCSARHRALRPSVEAQPKRWRRTPMNNGQDGP